MKSEHAEAFLKSAYDEVKNLSDKDTWVEDLKANATTGVVPSQWAFKVKADSEGRPIRHKGRVVLRGDLQEDDGLDNYSPVSGWPAVRVFLMLAYLMKWVTITIDFSNAFAQSDLPKENPVWMHIPRGFRSTLGSDHCLKLQKSLYGHKRAPQLWFKHVGKAFKKLGLTQSKCDECLWHGKDLVLITCVDDCGTCAPTRERIDEFNEVVVQDCKTSFFLVKNAILPRRTRSHDRVRKILVKTHANNKQPPKAKAQPGKVMGKQQRLDLSSEEDDSETK